MSDDRSVEEPWTSLIDNIDVTHVFVDRMVKVIDEIRQRAAA